MRLLLGEFVSSTTGCFKKYHQLHDFLKTLLVDKNTKREMNISFDYIFYDFISMILLIWFPRLHTLRYDE